MTAIEQQPGLRITSDETPGTGTPRVTPAMEDYLKAVYHLQENGDQVTTQRLAEELALSSPSVTNMVKSAYMSWVSSSTSATATCH